MTSTGKYSQGLGVCSVSVREGAFLPEVCGFRREQLLSAVWQFAFQGSLPESSMNKQAENTELFWQTLYLEVQGCRVCCIMKSVHLSLNPECEWEQVD